jgi:Formate/nitrite family of transporters
LGNIVGGAVLVGLAYYAAYKYKPSTVKESVNGVDGLEAN